MMIVELPRSFWPGRSSNSPAWTIVTFLAGGVACCAETGATDAIVNASKMQSLVMCVPLDGFLSRRGVSPGDLDGGGTSSIPTALGDMEHEAKWQAFEAHATDAKDRRP
ncbi:MAG: hypothetical protein H0W20_09310 [Chthoniobacterales bacterium]|nr:hypothetical protein [Chthoniobacterales bacterium]